MSRISPVRWPVRADEPDIDEPMRIIDPHHDAILGAGDVEDRAALIPAGASRRIHRSHTVRELSAPFTLDDSPVVLTLQINRSSPIALLQFPSSSCSPTLLSGLRSFKVLATFSADNRSSAPAKSKPTPTYLSAKPVATAATRIRKSAPRPRRARTEYADDLLR
jgi:hypothetical protein